MHSDTDAAAARAAAGAAAAAAASAAGVDATPAQAVVKTGEQQKQEAWAEALRRRRNLVAGGVEFVPFSIEAGGVWGPAARKFFRECLALADDDRDIDLYHWSSTRFSAVWRDTLSVLVARGRAQVSVAAAVADWPKRIRDMRYVDHEDYDGTD